MCPTNEIKMALSKVSFLDCNCSTCSMCIHHCMQCYHADSSLQQAYQDTFGLLKQAFDAVAAAMGISSKFRVVQDQEEVSEGKCLLISLQPFGQFLCFEWDLCTVHRMLPQNQLKTWRHRLQKGRPVLIGGNIDTTALSNEVRQLFFVIMYSVVVQIG